MTLVCLRGWSARHRWLSYRQNQRPRSRAFDRLLHHCRPGGRLLHSQPRAVSATLRRFYICRPRSGANPTPNPELRTTRSSYKGRSSRYGRIPRTVRWRCLWGHSRIATPRYPLGTGWRT